MKKILIFKGPNIDFENEIEKERSGKEINTLADLVEVIDAKNVNVNGMSKTDDTDENQKKERYIKPLVVIHGSDFASVNPHVILNFVNNILKRFVIDDLYIQNPPYRIEQAIEENYSKKIIIKKRKEYYQPSTNEVLKLYMDLSKSSKVVGQNKAKQSTCAGLFEQAYRKRSKPLVLLYYGPSGIGKTELAKEISKFYKGKLTRLQFSMFQTGEAYDYLFGADNTKASFAKDLITRESNVVLIDEFDKVSPSLYNAFYQVFDEGKFEDTLYKVDLQNCVFILTSNFSDSNDILTRLDAPIYSRIDEKIEFKPLTVEQKKKLITEKFEKILSELEIEDKQIIGESHLKEQYLKNADALNNLRMLNKVMEANIYRYLMDIKLKEMNQKDKHKS